jgi:hypothetical protein
LSFFGNSVLGHLYEHYLCCFFSHFGSSYRGAEIGTGSYH